MQRRSNKRMTMDDLQKLPLVKVQDFTQQPNNRSIVIPDRMETVSTITKEKVFIGIDPGVITGMAAWNGKSLYLVTSVKIHKAMEMIKNWSDHYKLFVRIEDARKRNWFGESGREQLQGAGSIKRDCKIWEDFLIENKIQFELVAPKNNKTKIDANVFQKITGWKEQTNEHSRDAAMLVYGINCKDKIDLNKIT